MLTTYWKLDVHKISIMTRLFVIVIDNDSFVTSPSGNITYILYPMKLIHILFSPTGLQEKT